MEQEIIHNEQEYSAKQTDCKNIFLLQCIIVGIAVFFCMFGNVMAQGKQSFPDTITMFVGEKYINLTRTRIYEYGIVYETNEHFTKNDTNYIYTALEYWWSDEKNKYICDTSYYFILSHKLKNHIQNVEQISCQRYWPKSGESLEYHNMCYLELKEQVPILNSYNLGDMPRRWYPLVKYDGRYYFSVDKNYVYEFCDSLIIFYGQEVAYNNLNDFCRLDNGGWSFSYMHPVYTLTKVTIEPCKHLKGVYIMTSTAPGVQVKRTLLATDESIVNFDIIDWRSTSHKEVGLNAYEKIDFDSLK